MDDIFTLNLDDLYDVINTFGEKPFRAKQLYDWLHKRPISSYSEITNLPKSLLNNLEKTYPLSSLEVLNRQRSIDGTEKFLFSLPDEEVVESVLIPSDRTNFTACLSSQVGCAMDCQFCATGKQGFKRNLTTQEIVFQVAKMQSTTSQHISNIVVMGQGEPFLNFSNTVNAIKFLNHEEAYKIASRKITVSTCGVIDGINQFSNIQEQFGLAISLHSTVQSTRNMIMPKMKNQPLESLREALRAYTQKTGRRVTLEYMLLEGVNDDSNHLEALIKFCNRFLCYVNLLKYNKIENSNFSPSSNKTILRFEKELKRSGIEASIRKSKGSDINGACGQLANLIK